MPNRKTAHDFVSKVADRIEAETALYDFIKTSSASRLKYSFIIYSLPAKYNSLNVEI